MNIKKFFRCKFSDFSSPLFVSLGSRTIRLFYQSEDCRSEAHEMLVDVKDYMRFAAEDAMRVLTDEFASQAEQDLAMKVNPFYHRFYIFFILITIRSSILSTLPLQASNV